MDRDTITVVSGLPRSGTSMMMKMLEAGGMEILTDNIREPDADNPEGYYEFERVKQVEHDKTWLEAARGKAVKMISALLKHLPSDYHYKVIFMSRDMGEILASQQRMLVRRGEATDAVSDEKMAHIFGRHLEQVQAWLAEQPNIDVIYVRYDQTVREPATQADRVNHFLGNCLQVSEMAGVVDPKLYRQRR
jgi:predicted transcriptional regulator